MVKRFISFLLICAHVLTSGYVRDAFAFHASSASYGISSGSLMQGGRGRDIGYSATKLLLHCDGPNGSKSFTDELGHVVTAVGDARVDAAQGKFGASSALFDNAASAFYSFSDDFSGGLVNWTPLSGSWMTSGGWMQKNTNAYEVIKVKDSNVLNGTIETVLKSVANYEGVVFRGVDANNYYFAILHSDGNALYIAKVVNGAISIIAVGNLGFYPGNQERTLKIKWDTEGSGIRFKAWLDGTQYIDYLEATATFPSAGYVGCCGLYSLNGFTTAGHYWNSFSAQTNNSYLTIPDSADWDFGAGQFSVDMWLYIKSTSGTATLIGNRGAIQENLMDWGSWNLSYDSHTKSIADDLYGTGWNGPSVVTAANSVPLDQWFHLAYVREGAGTGQAKIYFNGVLQANCAGYTGTNNANLTNASGPLYIGGSTGNFLDGRLDEIRISKGLARWTSNFTPPQSAYSFDFDNPAFIPVLKDSVGDSCIGKSQSASYILQSGYISTIKSSPPVQTQAIPNQSWLENASKMDAIDLRFYFNSPDGLPLTYTVSGTSHIVVNILPAVPIVNFSQPQGWFGTEKVRFTATDSEGNSIISNEVTLQVQGVNNPPVLDFIPDIAVSENELVSITPHATDVDNDPITYTFTAPLNSSGQWQTNYSSAGLYTVTVTAKDATNLSTSQQVRINVRNVNRPPVLNAIANISAKEGDLVTIAPIATDADNDPMTFYYSAPFDISGKWLTGYNDAGTHVVTVTASDGTDTVTRNVNVIVNNTNRAPEADLTLNKYTANPNESLAVVLNASDLDGDPMTYSLKKDAEVIASGAITGQITTNISFSSIGDHALTLTVTDSGALAATRAVGIDIVDPSANNNAIYPVMGDFNGDTLMDLGLFRSDTGLWEIAVSAAGTFTSAVDWLTSFGAGGSWSPVGGDFNGDSKTDTGIYNSATGEFKVALSSGSSFASQGAPWFTFPGASTAWQIFTGNFNADKYTDLAFYNKDTGEVKVSFGTGSGFGALATWLSSGDLNTAALSGDFNGDGFSDLCFFNKTAGSFKVFFSDSRAFVDGSTWLSGFASGQDLILSDFNHDGLTDVGYWDKASGAWYYAISSGSQFVDKGQWQGVFMAAGAESATTGDFNGDGIMDRALFDKDAQGINRWKIELNATTKPCDLMVEIDNGIGGKTKVAYTYAAKFDNAGLPFPVYVVSSVSLIDSLPIDKPQEAYTQNFQFSGGYYDAAEREFRGFAKARATDPITNNYSDTYFYQGISGQDGALKGQIEKIISYDGNGRQISQVINIYDVRKAGPADNVLGFPALTQVETTVWEENGSSLTTRSRIAYDNIGNPTQASDDGDVSKTGDEKSTTTAYSAAYEAGFNRPLEVNLKDKDSNIISKKTFEYDASGNISEENVEIVNPITQERNNAITQYSYDSFGNLLSTTNALGRTVTTEYETIFYAYPQRVTNTLGHSVSYVYDPKFGAVTSVTDPNNKTSYSNYDSLGRIVKTGDLVSGDLVTYSYPDFSTKITTNALGLSKTEYADGLGRKYKTVSSGEDGPVARAVSSEVYYNSRGLVEKESVAHYVDEASDQISYVRYEYDLRGRTIKTISDFPGTLKDAESSISYINPLYAETIDPQGHKKGTLKDVYGNVIEVTEFTSGGVFKTSYEYDVQNNLIKTTDSKGNVTQIWYDSIGRKLKMNDPDMGVWTYEYDLLGNLIKQTDAKNQILEFRYDVLNRLVRKVSLRAEGEAILVEYLYDDTSKPNCIGRLSKVTDQSGSTEFFYDNLGREVKSIKTVDDAPYAVERTHDILNRLLTLKYPDNDIVNYSYDSNSGSLEKVFTIVNGLSSIDYVKDITYNAKGQIKTIQYGNGTQTDYAYGQDLRLSRILTSAPVPQSPATQTLQDLNYIFDKNGNITTLTDNLRSNIRTYSYDDLDRLTQANNLPFAAGGYTNYNYQYDSIGNMIYKSDTGVMSYGLNAGPHAVTTACGYNYSYDANGNMTTGKNKTLEYDVENRIMKIIQPDAETTFVYDGDGGRVKQTNRTTGQPDNRQTIYIGSLFEIEVSQLTGSPVSRFTKHIYAGSQKICSVNQQTGQPDNRQTNYYHSDHLGSSSVITDKSGRQVAHYEYSPYGSLVVNELANGQTGQPVNHYFTGKELDSTGLYFYGARYYDPEIGRFITADTIVQAPYDPQSLNRYAYCRNNPLNYVDPTGHWWFIVAAIIKFAIAHPIITAAIAGAVLNTATNTSNIHSFGDFMKFAAIGAASGAAGAGVGIGVGGGFWGMVAGSFTGGFIGGAGNAGTQGVSFSQALAFGLEAGVIAAATAAIVYGASKVIEKVITAVENASKARASAVGTRTPITQQNQGSATSKSRATLKTNYDIEWKPVSFDLIPENEYPTVGSKVYRVYDSRPYGKSWTPIDPRTVPNYAGESGMYNKGRFLIEGTLEDRFGIVSKPADPGPYGNGGLREWVIPNPNTQVKIDHIYGLNPDFGE